MLLSSSAAAAAAAFNRRGVCVRKMQDMGNDITKGMQKVSVCACE